jgi:hypothetical protein
MLSAIVAIHPDSMPFDHVVVVGVPSRTVRVFGYTVHARAPIDFQWTAFPALIGGPSAFAGPFFSGAICTARNTPGVWSFYAPYIVNPGAAGNEADDYPLGPGWAKPLFETAPGAALRLIVRPGGIDCFAIVHYDLGPLPF